MENSSNGSRTRLEIDFAKEMSKLLKAMRSSKSMSEVNRDEIISICDELEKYGTDKDLLERAIRVRKSIGK